MFNTQIIGSIFNLKYHLFFFLILIFNLSSCASSIRFSSDKYPVSNHSGKRISNNKTDVDYSNLLGTTFTGIASYYADKFHGRATSSGEIFDMNDFTAAHKTLPFGTKVQVRNKSNNKTVIVKINDRGPFVEDRIIDLSRAAAEAIGMIKTGTAEVELKVIETP